MNQEWVFELSNGKFVAAGVEHNPPGYDGLITDALTSEEILGSKFYRRVPAEANSAPSMVFSQVLEVVRRICAESGPDVRLIALNNPTGIKLVSVQDQKQLVGDGVAVTVQDGPSA